MVRFFANSRDDTDCTFFLLVIMLENKSRWNTFTIMTCINFEMMVVRLEKTQPIIRSLKSMNRYETCDLRNNKRIYFIEMFYVLEFFVLVTVSIMHKCVYYTVSILCYILNETIYNF